MPEPRSFVAVLSLRRTLCLLTLLCLLLPPAPSSSAPLELPNLVPVIFPETTFLAVYSGDEEFEAPSGRGLHLTSYLLNAGSFPLEIQGTLDPQDPEVAQAAQCVAFDDDGLCEQTDAGGDISLRWYSLLRDDADFLAPEYCYSVTQIVRYELRTLNPDGTPNLSSQGLKESHTIDHTLEDEQFHGDYDPAPSRYPACAGPLRQGLSPGHMERRHDEDRDQYIDLAGLNGTYFLRIVVDPANRIQETDEADNTVMVKIRISGPNVVVLDQPT